MERRNVLRPPERHAVRCTACKEPPTRAVGCPRCGDQTCVACALAEPVCPSCGESLEHELPHATRDARVAERGPRAWLRACKAKLVGEADDAARCWSSDSGQQMTYPVVLFLIALFASLPLWALLSRWLGR